MNDYKISWAIDSLEVRTDIVIVKTGSELRIKLSVNQILDTDEIQSFGRGVVRSWETSVVNDWDLTVEPWENE